MTSKERVAVLAIFISVLGFSFVAALKPVMISYAIKSRDSISSYSIENQKTQLKTLHYGLENASSNMVDMLSEVLEISKEDILLSLKGGSKPSELLLSSGILLSDLSQEYSFDIVGESLVRFRA